MDVIGEDAQSEDDVNLPYFRKEPYDLFVADEGVEDEEFAVGVEDAVTIGSKGGESFSCLFSGLYPSFDELKILSILLLEDFFLVASKGFSSWTVKFTKTISPFLHFDLVPFFLDFLGPSS